MTATMDDYEQARRRLADAISECDRIQTELAGDPREPNEMLTHWVVVTSHLRVDAGLPVDASQVSLYASDGLAYWMINGLLREGMKNVDEDDGLA